MGLARRLGLAALAFAVTVLVIEGTARVVLPLDRRAFDPTAFRRVSPEPGFRFELIPGGGNDVYMGAPVHINALGFRDRELARVKAPGTVRILALGDSVTFGYGVGLDETYVKQLERRLNARAPTGRRYEVVNAGIEGAGLASYARTLQTWGPELQPDLVLVGLVLNDIAPYPEAHGIPLEPGVDRDPGWRRRAHGALLRRSQLYLASYLTARSLAYRFGWLDFRLIYGHSFLPLEPPSPARTRAWQASLDLLGRLVARARALESPLLLVLFPLEPQVSHAAHRFYEDAFGLGLDPVEVAGGPQRTLREVAARSGVRLVDLLPVYREAAAPDQLFLRTALVPRDPVHPSPLGHCLAAAAVADVIVPRLEAWEGCALPSPPPSVREHATAAPRPG